MTHRAQLSDEPGVDPRIGNRKILIGLSETSGYCAGLREGLRDLGYEVDFLELAAHPFSYRPPEDPHPVARRVRELQRRRDTAKGWGRKALTIRILALRTRLLLWALRRYRFVILNGPAFFLGSRELWAYRCLGVRVLTISQGSDTRPPYIDGTFAQDDSDETVDRAVRSVRRKRRLVRRFERSGATVISAPAWGHFQTRPFLNYLVMGFPVARPGIEPSKEGAPLSNGPDQVRVLHSPSRPDAKGTEVIRGMISSLAEGGVPVAYDEVIDEPNRVVLGRLADTDVVLDQLYASTPMAGFATEGALFGRPVVVGSYYAEHVARDVPARYIPPTRFVHPTGVVDAVRELAERPALRAQAGKEIQEFVSTRYAPPVVAARFVRALARDVPAHWWFDPGNIRYVVGGCIEEDRARRMVGRVIARHGAKALGVRDKPELEAAFVAFAAGGDGASATPPGQPLASGQSMAGPSRKKQDKGG